MGEPAEDQQSWVLEPALLAVTPGTLPSVPAQGRWEGGRDQDPAQKCWENKEHGSLRTAAPEAPGERSL